MRKIVIMRSLSGIILIIALVFIAPVGFAQNNPEKINPYRTTKLADHAFSQRNYYTALDLYLKLTTTYQKKNYGHYMAAECYKLLRDYVAAEKYYKLLLNDNPSVYPLARFQYALMLKMNGKYKPAIIQFNDFIKKYSGENPTVHKKMAKNEIQGCNYALETINRKPPLEIINLENINSENSDFNPFPANDNLLYYSSLPSDSIKFDKKKNEEGDYRIKLFSAELKDSIWAAGTVLPDIINDNFFHNANGVFSPKGDKFYFTKCEYNADNKTICAIYYSNIKNGQWELPVKLNDAINDPSFTSTHPAIAYEKGKEILYYSSDKPGGYGGMDIWYAVITADGEIASSINPGKKINTVKDEITPYYHAPSKALYFSSNGQINVGGFDIIKAEGALKKWSLPVNLGFPINSSVDDMYYVLGNGEGVSYLTSNRTSKNSKKSLTCCDDIYQVAWIKIIKPKLIVRAFEKKDSVLTPLTDVNISLIIPAKETGQDIIINKDTLKANNKLLFNLETEYNYKISGRKNDYFAKNASVSTIGIQSSDTIIVDLVMERMKRNTGYLLKNIYYDFDKATLRPESKNTIDSLVLLLEENPGIIIELGSHTDNRGEENYNIKLSLKRAESVVNYITEKGINAKRLVAKGYGETQPIAANENKDGTDNPEGRQLNRRTEFKIIGETKIAEED